MAKKKSKGRTRRRVKKSAKPVPPPSFLARLRTRLPAILIAVAFWAAIWWFISLRDEGISTERDHRHRTYATRVLLREIDNALAAYKKERGSVPPCLDEKSGAAVLFEKLLAGERRFLGPSPDRIRHGRTEDEPTVIVDSWGDPIRYRTGAAPGKAVTPNPEYDLWSIGGDPENPREKWITP